MNHSGVHSYEDKLLEFAYGELPEAEARSVEDHLKGCTRCASALESLQGVRRTMSQLGAEPAPSAGLDSLMAYAEQTARRLQAGPAPRPVWWRRLLVPVTGLAALAVVALVVVQTDNSKLSPSAMLKKEEAAAEKVAAWEEEGEALDKAPAEPVAQAPAAPAAQAPATPLPEPVQATKDSKVSTGKVAELSDGLSTGRMKKKAPSKVVYEKKTRAVPSDEELVAARPEVSDEAPAGEADAELRERGDFNGLQQQMARKIDARSEAKPPALPKRDSAEEQSMGLDVVGSAPGGGAGMGGMGRLGGAQPQAEEPAPKLSLPKRSSASVPRDEPAESSGDDDFDREISRDAAQPAAAPPPPPSPSSSLGGEFGSTAPRAPAKNKAAERQTKAGPREGGDASGVREFLMRAEKARHGRDRKGEVHWLQKAIDAGATGTELAQILSQLCDAEIALGDRQPASCQRLLAEFPDSSFAEHAQFQMQPMKRAAPSKAKAAPATKPADAEPRPAY